MPGIADMFKKFTDSLKGNPKQTRPTMQKANQPASPEMPQGFDMNLYMKALQEFANDFFGKQVPEFFKNLSEKLNAFPAWWNKQKQDEQLAYGGVLLGSLMIVTGIVLLIVV